MYSLFDSIRWMSIISIFKAYYNKIRFQRTKLGKYTLAGTEFRVLQGTVRIKPDKDDNWYFHLTKDASSIVDIGCNVGYLCLLAIATGKDKNVVFVDANEQALAKRHQI